mmetsp:Transcript_16175/g.22282  ORF Transcript_16175/g.22282 Transcript_16175/m.22282 type:complete len:508 (-) Transcript_16175:1311-2834(-)
METKNERHFDMRAAPRRRVTKEKDSSESENQPIFLRKAYAMISNCPNDIGGWSDSGDTVIIKDVKRFEEQIIPTVYKHNNFSSFVRQLNFYGFRKVKSAEILEPHALNWWEFRHPSFIRGQPQMLSEIKRAMHYAADSANSTEVQDLKNQVTSLTDHISRLQDQITELFDVVTGLQQRERNFSPHNSNESDSEYKKRKVGIVPLMGIYDNENEQSTELVRMASISSDNLLRGGDLNVDDLDAEGLDAFFDEWNSSSNNVVVSSNTTTLTSAASSERIPSSHANNSATSSRHSSSHIIAPPEPLLDISAVLEKLSPELKTRFVDQLADQLGKQLTATAHSARMQQQQLQQQHQHQLPPMPPMPFQPGYGYRTDYQLPPPYPSQHYHHPTAVYGMHDNSKYANGFPSSSSSQGFPVQERTILTSGGSLRTAASSDDMLVKPNATPSLGDISRTGVNTENQLPAPAQQPQGMSNIALPLVSAALSAFVLSNMNSFGAQQQLQTGSPYSEN